MGGGVSPFEWIFPGVALTHLAVETGINTMSRSAGAGNVVPGAPGSSRARQADARDQAEQKLSEQRVALENAEQERIAALPQTPQQQWYAKRRAVAASESLGSRGRRASSYLTDTGTTLSGVSV